MSKKKKLKYKLRMMEARIHRLENHVNVLESIQEAVCDDIDRLHKNVDMWAETPLKQRVECLEDLAITKFLQEHPDEVPVFEQLLSGLSEDEQERIRSAQREPTEEDPAWVLARSSDGSMSLHRYTGSELGGERVLEFANQARLEDLMNYLAETVNVFYENYEELGGLG